MLKFFKFILMKNKQNINYVLLKIANEIPYIVVFFAFYFSLMKGCKLL